MLEECEGYVCNIHIFKSTIWGIYTVNISEYTCMMIVCSGGRKRKRRERERKRKDKT